MKKHLAQVKNKLKLKHSNTQQSAERLLYDNRLCPSRMTPVAYIVGEHHVETL